MDWRRRKGEDNVLKGLEGDERNTTISIPSPSSPPPPLS